MPDSLLQWAMFTFFAIGSFAGWIWLSMMLIDAWKLFRR